MNLVDIEVKDNVWDNVSTFIISNTANDLWCSVFNTLYDQVNDDVEIQVKNNIHPELDDTL